MTALESDGFLIDRAHAHRAVLKNTVYVDLSHLGLIAVEGADAASFLQGQLSNDLNAVTEARSQLSAWCNAKGRVLALMRVSLRSTTYYLQLPRDHLESTLKRLRMYVLRSQVTLTDASDTLLQTGIAGADAPALLAHLLDISLPTEVNGVASTQLANAVVSVLALPGAQPRFAVIADAASAQGLRRQYANAATAASADTWSLLDIRAGLPAIHSATQDMFIPQMINLDLVGGLSFTKGCYPGQEIIARTHHLGAVKRRMYYACAPSSAPPAPGTALYSVASGNNTGHVIAAVIGPEGDTELLAVLPTADTVNQRIRLYDADGPLLHFLQLPYSLPE